MNAFMLGALLAAALVAAPFAVHLYLQRLPVAPSCPSCRATTRAVGARGWLALDSLPALMATYIGECARCGWRGRLRWRWATDKVRRRNG